MTKKQNLLGIFLAGATGILLLGILLIRAFFPRIILPQFDSSTVILLSLVALVLDHYIAHGSRRCFVCLPLYGALVFGAFPLVAFVLLPIEALKAAVLGAVIFPVSTVLFDSMIDRLTTAPIAKAAPLISAFGLYLAAQCLVGII